MEFESVNVASPVRIAAVLDVESRDLVLYGPLSKTSRGGSKGGLTALRFHFKREADEESKRGYAARYG